MSPRPLLLDLFSGAGGAARGYARAGFDVVGVDNVPKPDYPFDLVIGDALDFVAENWRRFDAIHASPPCQASSALTKGTNRESRSHLHKDLIAATRELLDVTGLPYVIENVQGAKIRRDVTLCGEMFGLSVIRHRYFEVSGFTATQPAHKPHRGRVRGWRHGIYYDGPYLAVYGEGGGKGTVAEWQVAMGIDWMSERLDIAEAIPPAFTHLIGAELMARLRVK